MGNYISRKRKPHIFSQPYTISEQYRLYNSDPDISPPSPSPPPTTEINWPPSMKDLEIANQRLLDLFGHEECFI
jgi:hypothetical protein